MAPRQYESPQDCVDHILETVGRELRVGLPLGLGKPNQIINEIFARAIDDPSIELTIFSALSLARPRWHNELQRRILEPFDERIFDDYPELDYVELMRRGELPDHIDVREFYYTPGTFLRSPQAQRSYTSINYTHALRELLDFDVNVLLQLVGVADVDGTRTYNLSCNTDISAELIPRMLERRDGPSDFMLVGQVNRNLPFMYGDAPIDADRFDGVLDDPEYDFTLFGPPNEPPTDQDLMIALRASALVPDGGTLQIGIGTLGNAVAWALVQRHVDNETYRKLLAACGTTEEGELLIERIGDASPFERGLYASTEMLVEGFLRLFEAGVLSRRVFDDLPLQLLVADGRIDPDDLDVAALDALHEASAIDSPLDDDDLAYLQRFGLLPESAALEDGQLVVDGARAPADLDDTACRELLAESIDGAAIRGGVVAHGGFFLGSRAFYDDLRDLSDDERRLLPMTSVHFTNHLYGDEELKRAQRPGARFLNKGMKVTLGGAVVSDGLEDGRVISGVGGQYNFVAMAHELEGGRSILMIPAVRGVGDELTSNIVFNYGHVTIPRHLRDIVVTEYGIADLRGKSDREVAEALIEIADSRFQDELVERAREAGKLPEDYELDDAYRHNTPGRIEDALEPFHERGALPRVPFGTDFTDIELDLMDALQDFKRDIDEDGIPDISPKSLRKTLSIPEAAAPYLERMGLEDPDSLDETRQQRILVYALAQRSYI
jgi:acyl-CoA hydrolase